MLYPPTHPYHLEGIGSHEDLLAASLDHVQTFYRSWYAPNNASLVVAGDFEPEQVRQWIEELYGHIPALECPSTGPWSSEDGPRPQATSKTAWISRPSSWPGTPLTSRRRRQSQLAASLLGEGEDADDPTLGA